MFCAGHCVQPPDKHCTLAAYHQNDNIENAYWTQEVGLFVAKVQADTAPSHSASFAKAGLPKSIGTTLRQAQKNWK